MSAGEVVLEVLGAGGWVRVGSIGEAEPCGSFTSHGPLRRDVIVFGWMEGRPGVWLSQAGVDVENEAVRGITSVGFDLLSDLREPLVLEDGPAERRRKIRLSLA
jgi:hypothetical protein